MKLLTGNVNRRGWHGISRDASGNAGITFETQGRCENEACPDFGREFAPGEWLTP